MIFFYVQFNPKMLSTQWCGEHIRFDETYYENVKLKDEIKQLKEEQFDNMEQLAKSNGMCLVDTHIFDKLIQEEQENKELKQFQEKYCKMQEYIESREVKYCDTCGRYGEEHIDLECDDDGCYWCKNCKKNDLAGN